MAMVGRKPSDAAIHVGRVARAHSLKGEIRLSTFDHDAPSLREGMDIFLGTGEDRQPFELLKLRRANDGILVVLKGVTDRSAAEALVGREVWVSQEDLPRLEDDEHWAFELVGYSVVDTDGRSRGTVKQVDTNAAQDLLVVDTGQGEYAVPLVDALVEEVDAENRRVVVRPIPGLLDDDAEEVR